jgi:alkanesulfonate monooxygenase SsuD/methylene tetrahydromethanopterin reductase-like flavin-dependent oxidoreductase (luciferase family)
MQIGIGLPAAIPGVQGKHILAWAKKADSGPFSSLGILDRLVYPNYEPLITLAAAAGATQRIRLMTTVLLAPLRNTAILAKQAASLDAISGGRITLGLGIGAREDDFLAASASFHNRGKHFDEQLATIKLIWSGQSLGDNVGPVGPAPTRPGGPEILIGGYTPAAIQRVGRWGDGFIAGGGNLQAAQQNFKAAEESWKASGRSGKPRLVGCMYVALGPDAKERGATYLRHYYGSTGPRTETMINMLPTTLEAIKKRIQVYAGIGTNELILWPCTPDLEQIDQLARLVG